MSIWGPGPFENDDAADWLTDLDEEPSLATIEEALTELVHPAHVGYAEIPECCTAVAAAEVLARLVEASYESDVLEDKTWSNLAAELGEQKPTDIKRYVDQACAAVDFALSDTDDSELQQVWQEDEDKSGFAAWTAVMQHLLKRLQAIATRLR
jgi:hypothetical protein